jgi:hypothetical protein
MKPEELMEREWRMGYKVLGRMYETFSEGII